MEDILLMTTFVVFLFIACVAWKLHDDFKRETKGLVKLPSKRRAS